MVLYHCRQCQPPDLKWLLTSSNHVHVPVSIEGKRQKKACLSLLGMLPETCTQHFCLYPTDHMGMHRKTHKKNWAMYLLKEVIYLATKKKKWDFIIRKKRRMDAGGQSPELLNIWGISSVQSLSHVQLFVIPWTAAHQASLSFSISLSLLKLMSIELMMLSNHLILCHSLLLLPSLFPSIRLFSNESTLHIRWPKCILMVDSCCCMGETTTTL